jgi:hypothetical protein
MSAMFPTHRVLWMPLGLAWGHASERIKHCCENMTMALDLVCGQHDDPWECPDVAVVYNEPFDEYGVPIRDGGMSYLLIQHCPWCGVRLPASQRDRWFDTIEALGLQPDDEALPDRYLSAAWRMAS